jgi:hypothetical protein
MYNRPCYHSNIWKNKPTKTRTKWEPPNINKKYVEAVVTVRFSFGWVGKMKEKKERTEKKLKNVGSKSIRPNSALIRLRKLPERIGRRALIKRLLLKKLLHDKWTNTSYLWQHMTNRLIFNKRMQWIDEIYNFVQNIRNQLIGCDIWMRGMSTTRQIADHSIDVFQSLHQLELEEFKKIVRHTCDKKMHVINFKKLLARQNIEMQQMMVLIKKSWNNISRIHGRNILFEQMPTLLLIP